MIPFGGWHFPDGEAHLPDWMRRANQWVDGRLTYQLSKYQAALPLVRARHVAVDVGGHIGLWSWVMARDFGLVIAFEPVARHRECWQANMADRPYAVLHPYALGAAFGTATVRSRTPGSSGDTGIEPDGSGERCEVRTLDSFGMTQLDFLKIDCEGYEVFVLKGAEATLLTCRPVVIVEQKPHTGGPKRYGIGPTDAVVFLESLGYRQRQVISGDYIMSLDA